jgi:hypothetical protein
MSDRAKHTSYHWAISVVLATGLGLGPLGGLAGLTPMETAMAQTTALQTAERLNQQVLQLYQQGQYQVALPLAERALAIREQALDAAII